MSSPNLPANLALSEREAIADALYRSVLGLDSNDKDLFTSSYTEDSVFVYNDYPPTESRDAILGSVFALVGAGLDTTHVVSCVRVDHKEGASTAKVTANAFAQHYRKGEGVDPKAPRFMTGNLYYIDVVKDETDGLWKMTKFILKVVWGEGDAGLLQGQ